MFCVNIFYNGINFCDGNIFFLFLQLLLVSFVIYICKMLFALFMQNMQVTSYLNRRFEPSMQLSAQRPSYQPSHPSTPTERTGMLLQQKLMSGIGNHLDLSC